MRIWHPLGAAALAALAIALAACGDDSDDRIEEASLRECLAAGELEIVPPEGTAAGASLGNASPDFSATTPSGGEVDVIVTGDDRAAERSAADVRAALLSFGVTDADVLRERNAVVVVVGRASEPERAAIEDCLGGG